MAKQQPKGGGQHDPRPCSRASRTDEFRVCHTLLQPCWHHIVQGSRSQRRRITPGPTAAHGAAAVLPMQLGRCELRSPSVSQQLIITAASQMLLHGSSWYRRSATVCSSRVIRHRAGPCIAKSYRHWPNGPMGADRTHVKCTGAGKGHQVGRHAGVSTDRPSVDRSEWRPRDTVPTRAREAARHPVYLVLGTKSTSSQSYVKPGKPGHQKRVLVDSCRRLLSHCDRRQVHFRWLASRKRRTAARLRLICFDTNHWRRSICLPPGLVSSADNELWPCREPKDAAISTSGPPSPRHTVAGTEGPRTSPIGWMHSPVASMLASLGSRERTRTRKCVRRAPCRGPQVVRALNVCGPWHPALAP